ncbi:CdaR family transcriptional regulator [Planomicrobium sp. CPCC 101110]|uniref:PucR family transcriptional regulator n=1 Tax=Planomicrobium sp. CPCC 101110 TaxID=2599619 RepID=UPI0011B6D713|nr:helix-turn-helix domain-containing protein [Planomicrobium sp. CPCC 101110]TWT27309.1 regulator of polyketide synthase expression [Planomicrobium sp. CPCC 101110]
MIEQLRKIYPSLLVHTNENGNLDTSYKWYKTAANAIIGIQKAELADKDQALLAAFLVPYDIKFPPMTEDEQRWKKAIDQAEGPADSAFPVLTPYRFIYFSMNKNQITPVFFHEALQELFEKPVPILWENESEGIIIEEGSLSEDYPSYEQMIDILMSDLYVKITFFVGPYQKGFDSIRAYYHSVIRDAKKVFAYSDKTVITYIDAVPYLLIDQADPALRQALGKNVLQEFIDDEDTLKMLETFVQSNLNISETAKELHLHRNSLQYRLDRFFEKTGIDVRQFHQAMPVYLAMLAKK